MKVLLISGEAGSGKDFAADIIADRLKSKGYTVAITHFADPLKDICKKFFAWNGQKDEAGRTMLQQVGRGLIPRAVPGFLVESMLNLLSILNAADFDYVLIPDARMEEEIKKVKAKFPAKHVIIQRPGLKSSLTAEQQQHETENDFKNVSPDCVLVNEKDKFVDVIDAFVSTLEKPFPTQKFSAAAMDEACKSVFMPYAQAIENALWQLEELPGVAQLRNNPSCSTVELHVITTNKNRILNPYYYSIATQRQDILDIIANSKNAAYELTRAAQTGKIKSHSTGAIETLNTRVLEVLRTHISEE